MIDFELMAAETDPKLLALYGRMVRLLEQKAETLEEGLCFAVEQVTGAVGSELQRIDYLDSIQDLRHALTELRLTKELVELKKLMHAA